MWRSSLSLNRVSQAIMATTSDLALLMDTVESVAKTMHYDHGGIFLLEEDGSVRLYVGYGHFLTSSFNTNKEKILELVRSALTLSNRGYVLYSDSSEERLVPDASWQVLYPLATKERLLGALFIACDKAPPYPTEAISLGRSLASLVAIGVQNVYLYQQREELAAAAERDRIARDIHDGIAQQLYMLSLTLETCLELAEKEDAQHLKDRLQGALTLSRGALWESRQYLLDIRPLFSTHGSLKEAIYGLVEEASAVNPIPIDFYSSGDEIELKVSVRTELYRVVQEAIANAYKHAKATQISVRLDFQPSSVKLEIADNGIGFSYLPTTVSADGHGLKNMRRRMEEIGGSLEIVTSPGRGTVVTATIPI